MSLLKRSWRVLCNDVSLPLVDRLLAGKSFANEAEKTAFLDLETQQFHDPFLLTGMDKAVERILQAIDSQEKIIIFGDYDVDGITGTAILYLLLSELGAKVSYRLPHRVKDGYGLNDRFIDEFIRQELDLLITVDCGISCKPEVDKATDAGIDVIITDHHHIPDALPDTALAIIHPKLAGNTYPEKELVGAAVAFKIAAAIIQKMFAEIEWQDKIEQYVDLAAMGTVADCAPLLGENRLIVYKGLQKLSGSSWPGVQALKQVAQIDDTIDLTTYHIGFILGPRINAVGRISDPYFALQMLINSGQKAFDYARKLEMVNRDRQEVTRDATAEAELKLQSKLGREKILIASSPDWHPGILGLIAGRIANEHNLPVMVMQEQDDKFVGSCRGPEGFDFALALGAHAQLLLRFGGHKQAAGFSVSKEHYQTFVKSMEEYARTSNWDQQLSNELVIHSDITPQEISLGSYNQLQRLRPFGIGNEEPVFLLKSQNLTKIKAVGKTKDHLSAKLAMGDGNEISVIGFNLAKAAKTISPYSRLDIACKLQLNRYQDKESIQLQIVDLRDAG